MLGLVGSGRSHASVLRLDLTMLGRPESGETAHLKDCHLPRVPCRAAFSWLVYIYRVSDFIVEQQLYLLVYQDSENIVPYCIT